MKKFILVGSALLISTAAFANDPIGLANNTLVLRPAAPSEATHRLYVQNLKAAGLYNRSTNPIGLANNTSVLRPDHSKVPLGGHWSGNAGTANNTSVLRPDHSKVPLGGHWSGNAGTANNTSVLRPDLPLGGHWTVDADAE
jgi:hypothetical protein